MCLGQMKVLNCNQILWQFPYHICNAKFYMPSVREIAVPSTHGKWKEFSAIRPAVLQQNLCNVHNLNDNKSCSLGNYVTVI